MHLEESARELAPYDREDDQEDLPELGSLTIDDWDEESQEPARPVDESEEELDLYADVDPDRGYRERGWIVAGRHGAYYRESRSYNACEGSRTRFYARNGAAVAVHGYCDKPAKIDGLCTSCYGFAKGLGIHHGGRPRMLDEDGISRPLELLVGESLGAARGRVMPDAIEEAERGIDPSLDIPRSAEEQRADRDIEIQAAYIRGEKQADIAERYGLSVRTVQRITKGCNRIATQAWRAKP